jgi:catechol 2,3-dioxygenase
MSASPTITVGHIHLRVADLDRAIAFYRDALGFRLVSDARAIGIDAAFLAAGDYHHHVALNTFESAGGAPASAGHTGLYHVGFAYPGRLELAAAVKRLREGGYPVDHASDHGATVSVYLSDPDGNGIELYYDRPREYWFQSDGRQVLKAEPISVDDLAG